MTERHDHLPKFARKTARQRAEHHQAVQALNARQQRPSHPTLIILCALSVIALYLVIQHLDTLDAPTWADFTTRSGQKMIVAVDMTDPPKYVIIDGKNWYLVHARSYTGVEGGLRSGEWTGASAKTYCLRQTITYLTDPDFGRFKASMMHEIFHAAACAHGGDAWWNSENPTATDHPGIYHLGEFSAAFIQQNPDFIKWVGGVRP